ncbi:NAD(P)/FAD-dependent oxidoreductase, partial [Nocardiopsis gilva]
MSDILIIGDGPAAHRLVERLRHHGHQDAVTVLGREPGPTHSGAPPLPFSGHSSPYQHGFPEGTRVRRGVTATRIDRARRLVHTDDGTAHGYDTLVLATGARPRVPDIPGVLTAEGRLHASVFTPRSLAARECRPAGSVAVLGAGAGGVEAALALRRAGREVALVDAASHPMKDRLDDAAGRLLAGILHDEGVETHLGHVAVAFEPGKLVLDGGRVLAADVLLLCTDAAPETGLAHGAGLSVDCGVLIDDEMRTDDPRIRAIGGCARHQEGGGETAYSLPQAWDQADTLALLLTGGR